MAKGYEDKNLLEQLISNLERQINEGDKDKLQNIRDPNLFLSSLIELNSMVGHKRLKNDVAEQCIQLLNDLNSENPMTDASSLNSVLYGPPGVGKTTVGKIMAKIWYSLGYLTPQNNSSLFGDYFEETSTGSFFYFGFLIGMSLLGYIFQAIGAIQKKLGWLWFGVIIGAIILVLLFVWALSSFSTEKIDVSEEDFYVLANRDDLVAEYLGQTTPKTRRFMEKHKGKVIIFDEAYDIMTNNRDMYGMQALTCINLMITENPKDYTILFMGYKHLLEQTVFKYQPGLTARFMNHFECDIYRYDDLFKIWQLQLRQKNYEIDPQDKNSILELFEENEDLFSSFGRDTGRLCHFSVLIKHKNKYLKDDYSPYITEEVAKDAMEKLRNNRITKPTLESSYDIGDLWRKIGA